MILNELEGCNYNILTEEVYVFDKKTTSNLSCHVWDQIWRKYASVWANEPIFKIL